VILSLWVKKKKKRRNYFKINIFYPFFWALSNPALGYKAFYTQHRKHYTSFQKLCLNLSCEAVNQPLSASTTIIFSPRVLWSALPYAANLAPSLSFYPPVRPSVCLLCVEFLSSTARPPLHLLCYMYSPADMDGLAVISTFVQEHHPDPLILTP
jgi:hypothetical protein